MASKKTKKPVLKSVKVKPKVKAKVTAKPKARIKPKSKPKAKPKKKIKLGQPLWVPTKAILRKVEKLSAQGMNKVHIADCIGIGVSTLHQKMRAFPELSDAFRVGTSKGMNDVTCKLLDMCKKGDRTLIKFYLRNKSPDDWNENRTYKEKDIEPVSAISLQVVDKESVAAEEAEKERLQEAEG